MTATWDEIWGAEWRTVRPFFSRFRSPTPVQERAIPTIRAGSDAVVIAPTASGKTEAILPPLLARHRKNLVPDEGPLIVYVAPTRALVADVVKRIQGPIRRMGGIVGERTSDRRTWSNGDACTVLVTTPESLDSVTMRAFESLSSLRGFIADEIHLLEGGPRGLQLRIVLQRIESTIGRKIQRVLSSATMPAITSLAARWCVDGRVIEVPGAHELEATLVRRDRVSEWPDRIREVIDRHQCRKVLAFANSRAGVEHFAHSIEKVLEPEGWVVRTHHSSLSGDERLQAERLFRESQEVLIGATSTLEVGIDIGDVDLVILDRPPFTLNSFLQRIGRGCRRTDYRRVVQIADDGFEARLFQALTNAARAGRSDGGLTPPLLAVAVQQLAASIHQKTLSSEPGKRPFLDLRVIGELLAPVAPEGKWERRFLNSAISAASGIGYIEQEEAWDGEGTFPILTRGSNLEKAIESRVFHVTFRPSSGAIDVVMEGANRVIGGVAPGDYKIGQRIRLSGRAWQITKNHGDQIVVRPIQKSAGEESLFPVEPGGRPSAELAKEVAKLVWPEWEENRVAVHRSRDSYRYAHFIGSEAAALLGLHLTDKGYDIASVTAFDLWCDRRWDQDGVRPTATDLEDIAHRRPDVIASLQDMGRLYGRIRENFASTQAQIAYDWSSMARQIRDLEICEVPPDALRWNLEGTDPVTAL